MRHEIIPTLRYADAPAAIDFLCSAFGFERRALHLNADDVRIVDHAQLVWQDRMIMVNSAVDTDYAKAAGMRTASAAGGPTMGLYLTVDDVDAHAGTARAAGADIVSEPEDQGYGGRGYAAKDPEGNIWSFGSYDPWADE